MMKQPTRGMITAHLGQPYHDVWNLDHPTSFTKFFAFHVARGGHTSSNLLQLKVVDSQRNWNDNDFCHPYSVHDYMQAMQSAWSKQLVGPCTVKRPAVCLQTLLRCLVQVIWELLLEHKWPKRKQPELLILLGSRTMVSKQQKPTTRNHLPIVLVHQCQRCVSFWNGGLRFIFTARHTFFCIDFLWLQLFQCFQFWS